MRRYDTRSNDTRSNDTRSNDTRSNDTRSNDTRSNDTRSNDIQHINTRLSVLLCSAGMGKIVILGIPVLLNGKESAVNRALGGSTYPG